MHCDTCSISPPSTLVTFHGMALAPIFDKELRGLETMVLRTVWGATRLSRAKEVIFSIRTLGHCISPVMHPRDERVVWMTRVACRPRATQVFIQAIWEHGSQPPNTGPFRWAFHMVGSSKMEVSETYFLIL